MKRKLTRIFCVLAWTVGIASPTLADETSSGPLEERVSQLERRLEKENPLASMGKYVTFSGAIELEGFFTDKNDEWSDEDGSDVDLATADLGVDVTVVPWAVGHMLFSWDSEDDNSVGIDEAYITFGATDAIPAYLTIGRIYLPFGVFETNMVSDPLTLEIGEVREGAVQVGVAFAGFHASVYGFNGDVDAVDEDDEIAAYGGNVGYAFENDTASVDLGAGYISNLLGSGMGELIDGDLEDEVGGFAAHIVAGFGPVGLIGEYVIADDEFEYTDGRSASEPSAWNAELSYTFAVAEKEVTLAAAYQGTDECAGFLPETRIMGGLGVGLTEHLGVTLEYAFDQDYDEADGGTDEEKNTVTFQVAMEF